MAAENLSVDGLPFVSKGFSLTVSRNSYTQLHGVVKGVVVGANAWIPQDRDTMLCVEEQQRNASSFCALVSLLSSIRR